MSKAAAIAITLVSCATLEVGARLLTGQPVFTLDNLAVRQQAALFNLDTSTVYDPLLGWITAPGIQKGMGNETLTMGEFSIRMNSPAVRKPPTGAVVAVGDSFTLGGEVEDDETWPAHLEHILGEPVLNAANGGWGTDQIVLRAMDVTPKLRPKVLLVSFLEDDILRTGYRVFGGANKPYFDIVGGELVHRNNPVPRETDTAGAVGRLRQWLGYSEAANIVGRAAFGSAWVHGRQYTRAGSDPIEVTCLLLRRIAQHAESNAYRLIFIMQYGGSAVQAGSTRSPHATRVLACAQQLKLTTLDLWQPLRDAPDLSALYIVKAGAFRHMSKEGNRFVAQQIERVLRR